MQTLCHWTEGRVEIKSKSCMTHTDYRHGSVCPATEVDLSSIKILSSALFLNSSHTAQLNAQHHHLWPKPPTSGSSAIKTETQVSKSNLNWPRRPNWPRNHPNPTPPLPPTNLMFAKLEAGAGVEDRNMAVIALFTEVLREHEKCQKKRGECPPHPPCV